MPLRNSLHRRSHKERSQLAHRSKLGLLEKHKDYVLRARDYRSKRERLRVLRLKAESRNRDEFYFGMSKKKTQGGVEFVQRGEGALPMDMVKLLKSQDEGYLRTVRKKGLKRIDAIKAQLTSMVDLISEDVEEVDEDVVQTLRAAGVLPGNARTRKGKAKELAPRHIVFVDNEEDATNYNNLSVLENEENESEDRSESQWSDEDEYAPQRAHKQEIKRQGAAKKHRFGLLHELSTRLKRDIALRHALRELEMQKHLMGPGARSKIRGPERVEDESGVDGGSNERGAVKFAKQGEVDYVPRVYRWRTERKR